MKYLFVLLVGSLLLSSCSEIRDNSSAFQGLVDTEFFRGNNNAAVINSDGSIAVRGQNGSEEVQVVVSALDFTTVTVGLGEGAASGNVASYIDEDGTVFTTNSDRASGEVSLEVNEDNTVTGTLRFVALTENETDTITFSSGFIYTVPILNEFGDGSLPTQGQNQGDPGSEEDSFTARVNGDVYVPTIIMPIASSGFLLINTSDGASETMSISMPEDVEPGTYDITPGGLFTGIYGLPSEGEIFNAMEGTLIIDSNDTEERRVSGSFIFDTVGGEIIITDGEFSVSY